MLATTQHVDEVAGNVHVRGLFDMSKQLQKTSNFPYLLSHPEIGDFIYTQTIPICLNVISYKRKSMKNSTSIEKT